MKKFIKLLALGLLLVIAFACKKESVQGVNIESRISIWVGETATLTPTFLPPNAHNKKVSWESSNTNVATVDNGKVTGVAIGQATITVTAQDGGRTAFCIVSVILPIEPEEMIWVEGGTFMMGCNDDECIDIELPRHEVTLSGFYISKYMITQKEWKAAMGEPTSGLASGDYYPACLMTWENVQEYINRLNAHTGKNYRLPTEAEWEYAARGGNKSKGYKYSGSNNLDEVGWYWENTKELRPVGQKKPNELGIYDMSGNVPEWCSDNWDKYPDVPQTNPNVQDNTSSRVMRGRGFTHVSFYCRISYRYNYDQTLFSTFRLVLPAERKKD